MFAYFSDARSTISWLKAEQERDNKELEQLKGRYQSDTMELSYLLEQSRTKETLLQTDFENQKHRFAKEAEVRMARLAEGHRAEVEKLQREFRLSSRGPLQGDVKSTSPFKTCL